MTATYQALLLSKEEEVVRGELKTQNLSDLDENDVRIKISWSSVN